MHSWWSMPMGPFGEGELLTAEKKEVKHAKEILNLLEAFMEPKELPLSTV